MYGIRLDFQLFNKRFNVLAPYTTHDSDVNLFLEYLEDDCNNLSLNKIAIFLGDINIDLINNRMLKDKCLSCLAGAGLLQFIDKPTRTTDNCQTGLFHIFVRNNYVAKIDAAVIQSSLTDHYSTGLKLEFELNLIDENWTRPTNIIAATSTILHSLINWLT